MDLSELNSLKQTSFTEFNNGKNLVPKEQNPIQSTPPPLPSRNANQSTFNNLNHSSFGGYNSQFGPSSFYNSYSNNNVSSYYNGGYGSYTSPFGNPSYGIAATNNSSNSFLRAAEDSSRTAFQSIESVVHAFSAVSAMFESTYYAVYNSFRAVVGVADQFYRLKTHLSSILSAFAVFRFLKFMYRKLLRILRLNAGLDNSNEAWSTAKHLSDTESYVKDRNQTNWPLIMFFAVVVGGPWLIWKILSSIESINKDDKLWMSGKIDHFIAVSEYDFDAENVDEISFKKGQKIIIAPKEYQPKLRGWLLGTVDGKTQGIVPANYLKILGKKIGENSSDQSKLKLKSEAQKSKSTDIPIKSDSNMEKIFEEI